MSRQAANLKRNRYSVNVEDSVSEALVALAEAESITPGELIRNCVITELSRLELLPIATLKAIAGVRT